MGGGGTQWDRGGGRDGEFPKKKKVDFFSEQGEREEVVAAISHKRKIGINRSFLVGRRKKDGTLCRVRGFNHVFPSARTEGAGVYGLPKRKKGARPILPRGKKDVRREVRSSIERGKGRKGRRNSCKL